MPRHNHISTKSEHRERSRERKIRQKSPNENFGVFVKPMSESTFKPITEKQRILVSSIRSNTLTFATGPAGTGKSFCALGVGVQLLKAGIIDTIVCLKPAVEIDSELGTLPGGKDEKLAVLYNPMRHILIKLLGKSHFENLLRSEKILFEPLGSILGMTYDNAMVIIDEAQHSTPSQMKVLLTRLGENSKVVVCGDYREQQFTHGLSGMEDSLKRLRHGHGVGIVEFEADDIVRSPFTKQIILAYRETELDEE